MGQRVPHWRPAKFRQNAPLAEDSHTWQGEGDKMEVAAVRDALLPVCRGARTSARDQRRVCTPTDITW